jgi:multicomponent Na+:H+ antiporter subunit B
MTGQWGALDLGKVGEFKLRTPLFFDAGIYLVVLGATLAMILTMAERE